MRQVVGSEVREGTGAIHFRRPNYRERSNELQGLTYLLSVIGVLDQLHEDQTWNGRRFGQAGKPGHGRSVATLDIDENVGIEEEHPPQRRRSARLRNSRACFWLSAMSGRLPMRLSSRQ